MGQSSDTTLAMTVSLQYSFIVFFIINFSFVRNDCILSLTRDFGSPGPVFIRNGAFMEVNTAVGNITFGRSETVQVSCPGTKRKILLGNYTTSYDTLEAHCISNTTFRVDRRIVNFKEIRCNTQPYFTTQESSETCHGQNHIYHVGYKVRSTFHSLYEACHDKNLVLTHFVKHRLTPTSVFRQNGLKRPPFTEGNMFGKIRMNEVYKIDGQIMALDAILGTNMSRNYLTKKQFLSRGHLTANADYPTSALIRATFHYVNTAPQWFRGNAGDWAALEDGLRRRVQARGGKVTVYTGTHGVMTLPDKRGHMQEVYLHADANNNLDVPVPMYFYKLVYDKQQKTAAVFISINSSFYNETLINTLLFCDNICDGNSQFSWLKWRSNDGTV
uniref:DNA/RNA non-specific endonuclease n=1 Tax=Sesamia inferens TaxID=492764 RepID=A0A219LVW0_SESIF|nr:DNA/RNA non-specific endonuclease [Sesamia inferens]